MYLLICWFIYLPYSLSATHLQALGVVYGRVPRECMPRVAVARLYGDEGVCKLARLQVQLSDALLEEGWWCGGVSGAGMVILQW